MKKVLINVPSLDLPGGVANHYLGLKPFWRCQVHYNEVGRRYGLPGLAFLLYDSVRFLVLIMFFRYDVVLLNPSLGRSAILRDSIFLILAKLRGLPVVVFFHGWDAEMQSAIDRKPTFFRCIFGLADAFVVLASEFSDRLRSWGIGAPVYLSTTKVDDRLIDGYDLSKKVYGSTILFLARLEENKGIILALDAFSKVLARKPDVRFLVAGSGSAKESATNYVNSGFISNVEFLGNVSGDELIRVFKEADIYILPTIHGEGMPTSVLEAMAFGLPIVTRPVGGLKDFFEDEEMGFISESLDPQWYADILIELLESPRRMALIGDYNHYYAKEHFLASKVALQLEEILGEV